MTLNATNFFSTADDTVRSVLEAMPSNELLTLYNDVSGKTVKKFSSTEDGIRRFWRLRGERAAADRRNQVADAESSPVSKNSAAIVQSVVPELQPTISGQAVIDDTVYYQLRCEVCGSTKLSYLGVCNNPNCETHTVEPMVLDPQPETQGPQDTAGVDHDTETGTADDRLTPGFADAADKILKRTHEELLAEILKDAAVFNASSNNSSEAVAQVAFTVGDSDASTRLYFKETVNATAFVHYLQSQDDVFNIQESHKPVGPGVGQMGIAQSSTTAVRTLTREELGIKMPSAKLTEPKQPKDQATRPIPPDTKPSRKENDSSEVITLKTSVNPKKAGTKAFDRFELYVDGMTVAEAITAGVRREDLRWDTEHKHIEIKVVKPKA